MARLAFANVFANGSSLSPFIKEWEMELALSFPLAPPLFFFPSDVSMRLNYRLGAYARTPNPLLSDSLQRIHVSLVCFFCFFFLFPRFVSLLELRGEFRKRELAESSSTDFSPERIEISKRTK